MCVGRICIINLLLTNGIECKSKLIIHKKRQSRSISCFGADYVIREQILIITILFCKHFLLFYNIRIPMNDFRQFLTRKLGAQAAKCHTMLSCAGVYSAHARFRPLGNVTVGFDTALANPAFLFLTAFTTFAAGCNKCKINR